RSKARACPIWKTSPPGMAASNSPAPRPKKPWPRWPCRKARSRTCCMSDPALVANSDSLREAFGKTLAQLGDEFPNLVVLDADLAGGTGVHHFRKLHPQRLIQFGIAEQNMMAAAGGMASVGLLPVV